MVLFIGRRRELSALDASLREAADGRGNCVLVSGEAGIGKSRLVAETRKRARRLGFAELEAVCQEQDRYVALASLASLMQRSVASPAESRQDLAHLLRARAGDRPLLVTIEDIHWSDDASQQWLLDLVAQVAGFPLLLLLSSRAPAADYDIEGFVERLEGHDHIRHLRLRPWSRQEVETVMRTVTGADRSVRFYYLANVFNVTGGNPLFVEELCLSSRATEAVSSETDLQSLQPLPQANIPHSVRRIIGQRIATVSRPAQTVAYLCAVHRRDFNFDLLGALTGSTWWRLRQLCEELVQAQLLVEDSEGRFHFRHALVRESLHERLLIRERRMLHERLTTAIEQVYAQTLGEHLADLTYHAYEAGCWDRALTYARLAGERALSLDAPRAAAAQFTRAIGAATRLSQTPAWPLHCQRAKALERLGEIDGALTDYATALDRVRLLEDEEGERLVIAELARLLPSLNRAHVSEYYRKIAGRPEEQKTSPPDEK